MHQLISIVAAAIVAVAMPSDAPTESTVVLAARAGLTPESLVVAGFTPTEAAAIVDNLGANGDYATAVAAADSLAASRATALAGAEAALAGSPGDSELIAARNAARVALAAAQAAQVAAPATVRGALLVEADSGKKAALETYLAGAGRRTPPEFKAISRTPEEWAALEGALRAEARAARRSETLAGAQASLLSASRSNGAVAAAKARLDTNLASAQAAFTPAQ